LYCSNNPLIFVQFFKVRPYLEVPSHLKEKHSIRNYQKNYLLQTFSRYLLLFFLRNTRHYRSIKILESVLTETLV